MRKLVLGTFAAIILAGSSAGVAMADPLHPSSPTPGPGCSVGGHGPERAPYGWGWPGDEVPPDHANDNACR